MSQELLASLRILAHVVRADSKVRSSERLALDALGERDGATAHSLVHDETDLDTLIASVTSPEIRRRTLIEAVALANVDGKCSPEELAVLERIRDGFGADGSIDLVRESAAWKRRSARIRDALDKATEAYLHQVHDASHADLSMDKYEKMVGELARSKEGIQRAFADVVEEVEGEKR